MLKTNRPGINGVYLYATPTGWERGGGYLFFYRYATPDGVDSGIGRRSGAEPHAPCSWSHAIHPHKSIKSFSSIFHFSFFIFNF